MLAVSGYVVPGHVNTIYFLAAPRRFKCSSKMSMFSRTPTGPSGGVNHERIEMAINE